MPRIKRLYIPFATWGVIYFGLNSLVVRKIDALALIRQVTIGVPACPPLYFMMLLVVSTALIWMIVKYVPPRFVSWSLAVILLACFAAQYSGVNAWLFGRLSPHAGIALGRYVELLPAAILGYAMWMLRGRPVFLLASGLVAGVFYVVSALLGWNLGAPGFSYQGVRLVCLTLALATIAVWIGGRDVPLSQNVLLANGIKTAASMTAGIYYVHLLIGKALELFIGRHRGYAEALAVFALSACFVALVRRNRFFSVLVK